MDIKKTLLIGIGIASMIFGSYSNAFDYRENYMYVGDGIYVGGMSSNINSVNFDLTSSSLSNNSNFVSNSIYYSSLFSGLQPGYFSTYGQYSGGLYQIYDPSRGFVFLKITKVNSISGINLLRFDGDSNSFESYKSQLFPEKINGFLRYLGMDSQYMFFEGRDTTNSKNYLYIVNFSDFSIVGEYGFDSYYNSGIINIDFIDEDSVLYFSLGTNVYQSSDRNFTGGYKFYTLDLRTLGGTLGTYYYDIGGSLYSNTRYLHSGSYYMYFNSLQAYSHFYFKNYDSGYFRFKHLNSGTPYCRMIGHNVSSNNYIKFFSSKGIVFPSDSEYLNNFVCFTLNKSNLNSVKFDFSFGTSDLQNCEFSEWIQESDVDYFEKARNFGNGTLNFSSNNYQYLVKPFSFNAGQSLNGNYLSGINCSGYDFNYSYNINFPSVNVNTSVGSSLISNSMGFTYLYGNTITGWGLFSYGVDELGILVFKEFQFSQTPSTSSQALYLIKLGDFNFGIDIPGSGGDGGNTGAFGNTQIDEELSDLYQLPGSYIRKIIDNLIIDIDLGEGKSIKCGIYGDDYQNISQVCLNQCNSSGIQLCNQCGTKGIYLNQYQELVNSCSGGNTSIQGEVSLDGGLYNSTIYGSLSLINEQDDFVACQSSSLLNPSDYLVWQWDSNEDIITNITTNVGQIVSGFLSLISDFFNNIGKFFNSIYLILKDLLIYRDDYVFRIKDFKDFDIDQIINIIQSSSGIIDFGNVKINVIEETIDDLCGSIQSEEYQQMCQYEILHDEQILKIKAVMLKVIGIVNYFLDLFLATVLICGMIYFYLYKRKSGTDD